MENFKSSILVSGGVSGAPGTLQSQSSDLYFLTNLLSQTTQSFPSLSATQAVTTATVLPGSTMTYRKAAIGTGQMGGATGASRLHRFGSSDSDMEQQSSARESVLSMGRKSVIDSSYSGAGDGSFPLIDAKSMSDFFSELEEEVVEFPSSLLPESSEEPEKVSEKTSDDKKVDSTSKECLNLTGLSTRSPCA